MIKRIISILMINILLLSQIPNALSTYAAYNEIVINTKSSQYTEVSGQWSDSSITDADGTKTRYSSNGTAQWRPQLEEGTYLVSVYKLVNSDSDKAAKFQIFYNGGSEEVTVDYTNGSTGWVSLGAFPFKSGTEGYVELSKGSGTVRTASVKFEKIDKSVMEKADAAINFVDIEYSEYKESIELLAHLGIMRGIEKNEFGPTFHVTRAEFATLIAQNILKFSLGSTTQCPSDVEEDYWAKDAICAMKELGYMTGFEDGTFHPEDNVTYNQVIKTLVSVLGYDYKIQAQGNKYPTSWLNVAGELGLFDGTTLGGEEKIKRETLAKILENALEVEIPKVTYINKGVIYNTYEDKTLLAFLGYQLIKGRIAANEYMALDGSGRLPEGCIKIDDVIYYTGYTDADEFIGQSVEMYATKSNEGNVTETAIYIREGKDTTVITLDAEEILDESDVNCIYYYEDEKVKKIRLDNYANMIYNGNSKLAWDSDDFKLEAGYVKVIVPSMGYADTVFVNNYKNLVVDDVDKEKEIIYFKNQTGEWRSITLGDYDAVKITDAYGADLHIGKINSGDLLSVAISADKGLVQLIASDMYVTGTVSAAAGDSITVDSTEYKYANNIKNDTLYILPAIGDTKKFLLDFQGKIAAIENDLTSGSNYAYIINMTPGPEPDNISRFKLIDALGTINIYEMAEKLYVNDTPYTYDNILSCNDLLDGGSIKQQLIVYKLNAKKQINRIYTATDLTDGSERSSDCKLAKEASAASATFRGGKQTAFSSRYFVGDNTLFFMVPSDQAEAKNERAYSVYSKTYFTYNGEKSYSNIDFYDIDENQTVAVIVQKVSASDAIRHRANVAIVTSVGTSVDSQNNLVDTIRVYVGGKEKVLFFDDYFEGLLFNGYAISDVTGDAAAEDNKLPQSLAVNKLNSGDIIQYELNSMGSINKARVLFRANSPKEHEYINSSVGMTNASNDTYASIYYAVGTLDKKLSNGIMYTVTGESETKTRALVTTGAMFYKLESKKGKITVSQSSLSELVTGDMIFIRKNGNDVAEVVICP